LDKETMVKASEGVIHTTLDNEIVLMHVSDGKYYGLNEVGSFLWEHIKEPAKVKQICSAIESEFEVEPDECHRDVLRILGQLFDIGLVEIVDY